MPISEEISKQIARLSHKENHSEIISYLRGQLDQGTTTAQEILDYGRDYTFSKKDGKPYVINAATINLLGVVVGNIDDPEQKKLAIEFYKLAAERGSSWGNRNYATILFGGWFGVQKSPKDALNYVKKAVELSQNVPDEKDEHKFILAKVLRENSENQQAIAVLIEYMTFKLQKIKSEKDLGRKATLEEEIKQATTFLSGIVTEFCNDFQGENSSELTNSDCHQRLDVLLPILSAKIVSSEFLAIKQWAYYFQGQYYEKLGERSLAWLAYCSVRDKTSDAHNVAIDARVRLLKSEVEKLIPMPIVEMSSLHLGDSDQSKVGEAEEKSSNSTLLCGIPFPSKFGQNWTAETAWMSAVDTTAMEVSYNKRLNQVDRLIKTKKEEISILDELSEDVESDSVLVLRKKSLEDELKNLRVLKTKLTEKYTQHLPRERKVFRRHIAELRFFNPSRSKKKDQLVELAKSIIDHRYRSKNSLPVSINLTRKSTRLFISAEIALQEAILSLCSEKSPYLGIPVEREEDWKNSASWNGPPGSNKFGPIETYQVDTITMGSEHRADPKPQRIGTNFVCAVGSYSFDIYPFLSKLSQGEIEKEKQLASLMIRYGKIHRMVTLEELKNIYEIAAEDDLYKFHRICFLLMDREQMQWLSATDKQYHLGMTVSQARCLIMIEAGFLGFQDAFKNSQIFSVYSHKDIVNNPREVAVSCQYIDDLYMVYLQHQRVDDHMRFFKKYISEEFPRASVLTREQAHRDMRYIYGGESDTDDDGYNTDLSM